MTFSEIMEFYPEHNSSVYEELRAACRRGGLIPFAGAGLSAFCGYQGWPSVLRQLAQYIYDGTIKAGIEKEIDAGELLQAAQDIQDHYPRMLRELRKIIAYDKIKNCENERLCGSAVYVLPYLFPNGLVMTTNFDRVLEEVYDRCRVKFGKVITPYEPDLLTQIRQSNPHCLFKLHGDIGPEVHDIERLIFTKAQYDKAYAGPLMRELPQWFQNKTLLFLGCSLAKDRTMEVLQQATMKNPGLDHYAILGCAPEEVPRRCMEMGELGISAIYYPKGEHEAVRVVLERLLEDTDHSAYEELKRTARKYAPVPKAASRFMYDSDYIAFIGRKRELAQLEEFCQDSRQISWWAVAGPGGIGKSRLVYEFTNAQKTAGWKVFWLRHKDYDGLAHWVPPADRCIVIADDVQAHLQTVGEWITFISGCLRSEKLRILLLEREGKDLRSAKWVETLQSDSPYDDAITSGCYSSDFLSLAPLSDEELKAMMADFAKASGKPLTDSEHAERLLLALKKMDGSLQRPIYALAITDAWCGGKDPTCWNKEQVLDALITREFKFYYGRLRNLSTEKITKVMQSELENLLARACLEPFLPLEMIPAEDCPKLRRRADKLDMTFPELLRQIGVSHEVKVRVRIKNGESEEEVEQTARMEAVVLDCPDLVKEYLVLRQALDKEQFHLLFPEGWDNDPMQLLFLMRLLRDYPDRLEESKRFCDAFLGGEPESELPAEIYSNFLFNATIRLSKIEESLMERLERLQNRFSTNENIALYYAKGLVNRTAGQPLEDGEQSVEKLRWIHGEFPASEKLTIEYVGGLTNLAGNQKTVDDSLRISEEIRLMHEQFPSNEEIAVAYADGIISLSYKRPEEICLYGIEQLKLLRKQFPSSESMVAAAVFVTVNLSFAQTKEEDIRKSIEEAGKLLAQYPKNVEMQVAYAQTQFNLTLRQEGAAFQESVAQLREYLLAHLDANPGFQAELDTYLEEHPDHAERYAALRV